MQIRQKLITTSAALAAIFVLLAGCASVKIDATRNPSELYQIATEMYLEHHFDQSEEALKVLMENYPLSPYAVEAQLLIADLCYMSERYEEAASYYTNFAAIHPSHPRGDYAFFQKGMSNFKEVLTLDRDQTATRKALFAFEDLLAEYPRSQYIGRAKGLITFLRSRLASRELYIGKYYFKNKNYVAALARFRDLLSAYPDSDSASEALYYIGESYLKLGEDTLATEAFNTLITNYPKSPFVDGARSKLESDQG